MVTATATGKHRADAFWRWLRAFDPLEGGPGPQNFVDFALRARPEWMLDTLGEELQERKRALQAELERRRAAKRKVNNGND
jgi:hypothetical protein